MTKELKMTSSSGLKQSFALAHIQRILVYQKLHPGIKDVWSIESDEYIFDDTKDELIRKPNKATVKETKPREGTVSK